MHFHSQETPSFYAPPACFLHCFAGKLAECSFENGNLALSKTEAPPVSPTKLSNEVGELESEKQELSGHLLL